MAKKQRQSTIGLKQLSLLDCGFSKPSLANQAPIQSETKKQEPEKPFFHTQAELPKIRKQNMQNYADLTQYEHATDHEITAALPNLESVIQAECRTLGQGQADKVRKFYSVIHEPSSRILIHKFIRQIPKQTEVYYYRLATELWLIKKKTFTKVFLQVLEILSLLDPKQTPHVIRGSAGSCLVCYLLGITDSDPIHEDISLARFMHAARDDLPDIDMDFPHNQREAIYAKIFATWPQRVARISNHVAYGAKTALKQVMREHGVKGLIPKDFELTDYFTDPEELEEIRTAAEELEGQFKHFSLHCGGIVIFDQQIPDKYYLQGITALGEDGTEVAAVQINLNKDQVDDYAFIKIDILSNRGLSQLWDISNMPILDYPQNDHATLSALSAGRNIGLTYAESRAIGKTLQHIQPKSVHDIAMALAIIRPAASGNGQKMDFLRDITNIRTGAGQQIDRDYIIYDDDAIQIINRLLNCGESKADVYRKAFAKRKFRLIKEFRDSLDIRRADWPVAKRDAICDQLACLQDYSFCKSHALSYAKLVYALAYQKTHNPVRFWLAALNNCNSSYRQWVHFREAVAAGCQLTPGRGPWRISSQTPNLIEPISPYGPPLATQIDNVIQEYFRWGFWSGPEFLPGMYHHIDIEGPMVNVASKKALEPIMVYPCRFRGLIATHRVCKSDRNSRKYSYQFKPAPVVGEDETKKTGRWITFVTLGIADGKYIDIVLYGAIRLGKCHVIEGEGFWMNNKPENAICPWIRVKNWKSAL
jgi:DNA polymerase III alpha subunit